MYNNESWVLLGILFGAFAIFGTILRIGIRCKIDLVDWFTSAFGLFNGFSFSFIIWMTYKGQNDWLWTQWIVGHKEFYGVYLTASLLFLLSTWIGSSLINIIKSGKNFNVANVLNQNETSVQKKEAVISWLMLFISIFSYFVYIKGYGGVGNLIKYAPFIRSGHFELIPVVNRWTFLERIGSFSFFSSFVFFGLILSKKTTKKMQMLNWSGLITSFSLSIFILYARLGRLSLVSYLIVFPVGYLLFRYRMSLRTITRLVIIFIISVFFIIPQVSALFKKDSNVTNISSFYASQMSFPYVSFFAQMDNGQYRYMKDIVLSPVYILPDRIFKDLLHLDSASDINTARIKGAVKGEDSVSGEMPVDILTFAFMQGGILGLFLVGILWGGFLLFVNLFISLVSTGVRELLYAFSIINVAVLTIPYGDPRHFLLENIYFVVGITAFFIFGIIQLKAKFYETKYSVHS